MPKKLWLATSREVQVYRKAYLFLDTFIIYLIAQAKT